MLHVDATKSEKFTLTWKQGPTVISSLDVPRASVDERYPNLASKAAAEWHTNGAHRDTSDRELDQAVIHMNNNAPFVDTWPSSTRYTRPSAQPKRAPTHFLRSA